MDDVASSILLNLSVASALYSCLEEKFTAIQALEKFSDYYIQNEIKRWLDGVFDVAGARNWEDVKGKMVLALYTDSYDKKCMGLASMYGDKTFIF